MGITVYSLAISIVFYNLALIAVFILRRSPGFRAKHAVSLLAFITVLGVVRLVLPIDFDAAYVVRSYTIIPAIENFLKRPLTASFTYGHLLLALWAVGSLVMVIKDVRLQRRFDRYLQSIDFVDRPELLEIAAEYGSYFAVLISPQLNMPFTSGILHPVIYLPDVELSDAEWRMVFCHEITHIRSRDNLKKLFFLAIEVLFWWNPLAHFSSSEINILLEFRCDALSCKMLKTPARLVYIKAIKDLAQHSSHNLSLCDTVSFFGAGDTISLRIEAILHNHKTIGNQARYGLSAFLGLLFVCSYFVVVQPARFPTSNDIILPDEYPNQMDSYYEEKNQSIQSAYILFEDGNYYLVSNGKKNGLINREALSVPPFDSLTIIGD